MVSPGHSVTMPFFQCFHKPPYFWVLKVQLVKELSFPLAEAKSIETFQLLVSNVQFVKVLDMNLKRAIHPKCPDSILGSNVSGFEPLVTLMATLSKMVF